MRAPKSIEGLIELRGRGIVSRPFVAEAPLHLVVDLVDHLERMVEEDALVTLLAGVAISALPGAARRGRGQPPPDAADPGSAAAAWCTTAHAAKNLLIAGNREARLRACVGTGARWIAFSPNLPQKHFAAGIGRLALLGAGPSGDSG